MDDKIMQSIAMHVVCSGNENPWKESAIGTEFVYRLELDLVHLVHTPGISNKCFLFFLILYFKNRYVFIQQNTQGHFLLLVVPIRKHN